MQAAHLDEFSLFGGSLYRISLLNCGKALLLPAERRQAC